MSRTIDKRVRDAVLDVLGESDDDLATPQIQSRIEERTGRSIARRTLQRRLTEMVDEGLVQARGGGRGVRYGRADAGSQPPVDTVTEEAIPLSTAAEEVRTLVRRPITQRQPVGHHPEFLEDYVPGTTWYLTVAERAGLHELGGTPVGERPAGTYAREILDRLLIDLSWASSRLEGNTYSRLDTRNLIEFGQRAEGKEAFETQMILNHKAAIEMLVDQADGIGFNLLTFRNLHALLAENLLADAGDEGRIRRRGVQISGSVFTPLAIPQRIEESFSSLLVKAEAIPDPFEQSLFLLAQIAYLQPFVDVNKRVSRLGANLPLIKANLCPLSFVDVPFQAYVDGLLGVYELNRVDLLKSVFLWAYERSSRHYGAVRQSIVEPDPFRLRYKTVLSEVLGWIIREGAAPMESTIRDASRAHVPPADLERFVELALGELLNLHDGNIARYRLRPGEFQAWNDRWRVS